MQCPLRPPDDSCGCGNVVRRKGRILGFVRHGYGVEEPIHFESEGIKRVLGDLARYIKEQSVIDVESFSRKWKQASEYGHSEK